MAKKKHKKTIRRPKKEAASVRSTGLPCLQFPPGPVSGLTSVGLSIKERPAIVREILQNSLDAAADANRDCADVVFSVESVSTDSIPGMSGYKAAVEGAIQFSANRSHPGQSKAILNSIKARLEKATVPVLFISDNGIGLDKIAMSALLSDGINYKQDSKKSSGSHGNGHFTIFGISALRYLLYGGVSQNDGCLISGHAILSSHSDRFGKGCGKDGFFVIDYDQNKNDETRYTFASDEKGIPKFIWDKLQNIKSTAGTGALFAVVDFNFFGDDSNSDEKVADLILGVAARNFFVAVQRGNLTVKYQSATFSKTLGADNLQQVLENVSDEFNRNQRGFPNHKSARRFHNLFVDGKTETHSATVTKVETDCGFFNVYYRQGIADSTAVALCRNGMWITQQIPQLEGNTRFNSHVPFEALLLCDAKDPGDLPALVRTAETNLHNQLNLQTVEDPQERGKLRDALRKTHACLLQLIDKQNEEVLEFLSLDTVNIKSPALSRSIRPVDKSGQGNGGGRGGAKKGGKRGSGKPKPGARINVRCVSVRHQKNKMKIRMVSLDAAPAPDVELSLARCGGRDLSCDNPQHDNPHITLLEVKCDDKICTVNNDTARIGPVKEGDEKNIWVKFKEPSVKGNYKVDCIFTRRNASLSPQQSPS